MNNVLRTAVALMALAAGGAYANPAAVPQRPAIPSAPPVVPPGGAVAQPTPPARAPVPVNPSRPPAPAQTADVARAGNPFTQPAPSPAGVAPKADPFKRAPAPVQNTPPVWALPPPLPAPGVAHIPVMPKGPPLAQQRLEEVRSAAGAKKIGVINGITIYRNEKNEYACQSPTLKGGACAGTLQSEIGQPL